MLVKLCELNAENLFISLDLYEGGGFDQLSESQWKKLALPQLRHKQKPINKIWGLITAIQDINPDILMLIEVGGQESLEHFNNHFLNGAYTTFFVETNSNRSIDLAFLIKKDFLWKAQAKSHRHTPVTVDFYEKSDTSTRFSRDVAELHLFENDQLKLILLLTHLKSKISTDTDYQGRDMRRAEANALALIYQNTRLAHPHVPVVVGGDFNSDLKSPELELIAKTDLVDFHDIVGSASEDRVSQMHFDHKGQPQPQVLDYLLVSPHLSDKIIKEQSLTYRYKSFHDIPHPLPTTLHQRYHMPSDHFPLVLTLDLD